MALTKEELTERAQIVRAWEAACKIEHPTDQELAFRIALAKRLAQAWGLRELRDRKFDSPIEK